MKKEFRPVLLAVVFILSLIPQFRHGAGPGRHVPWWDRLPGFYGLFGFIGCLALIALSLGLGKILLHKDEGYYDHD